MVLTRDGASLLTTIGIFIGLFFIAYHALGAYAAFGPHYAEYKERLEFLSIPNVHKFAFLAGPLAECRSFLSRGLIAPWILQYVESLRVVQFFLQGGYLLGLSIMTLLVVAMVLGKCLLSERYAVDQTLSVMQQSKRRMRSIEKRQQSPEEENVLIAAAQKQPDREQRLLLVEEVAE